MKKLFFLTAILGLALSCSEDSTDDPIINEVPDTSVTEITVTSSNFTGSDISFDFASGDALGAWITGTTTIEKFAMSDYASSTFSVDASDSYRLIYPYDSSASIYANGSYTFDFSEQTTGLSSSYMVSSSLVDVDATSAKMSQVSAAIDLELTFSNLDSELITISKIVVNGVSPVITVDLDLDTTDSSFIVASSGESITVTVDGTDALSESSVENITFNVPSNIDLSAGASVDFYLTDGETDAKVSALIPVSQTLSSGVCSTVSYDLDLNGVLEVVEYAVWDGSVATSFAGGSGTESDPYQISTGAELAYLGTLVNDDGISQIDVYFEFTANLDLNNIEWTPIGDYWSPFKGMIEGGNHYIKNLYCKYEGSGFYEGLFGCISIGYYGIYDDEGTWTGWEPAKTPYVKNLAISGTVINSVGAAGGLVGYIIEVDIINCSFQGTVKGGASWWGAGLLIAESDGDCIIRNCYAIGDVELYANDACGGGIIGSNWESTLVIENCYFAGTITGETGDSVGGIIGYTKGTDENCYSLTGSATGANGSYGTVMTEAQMTSADFVTTLNTNAALYEGACEWEAGAIYPAHKF